MFLRLIQLLLILYLQKIGILYYFALNYCCAVTHPWITTISCCYSPVHACSFSPCFSLFSSFLYFLLPHMYFHFPHVLFTTLVASVAAIVLFSIYITHTCLYLLLSQIYIHFYFSLSCSSFNISHTHHTSCKAKSQIILSWIKLSSLIYPPHVTYIFTFFSLGNKPWIVENNYHC